MQTVSNKHNLQPQKHTLITVPYQPALGLNNFSDMLLTSYCISYLVKNNYIPHVSLIKPLDKWVSANRNNNGHTEQVTDFYKTTLANTMDTSVDTQTNIELTWFMEDTLRKKAANPGVVLIQGWQNSNASDLVANSSMLITQSKSPEYLRKLYVDELGATDALSGRTVKFHSVSDTCVMGVSSTMHLAYRAGSELYSNFKPEIDKLYDRFMQKDLSGIPKFMEKNRKALTKFGTSFLIARQR